MGRFWARIRGWLIGHKIVGTAGMAVALLAIQLAYVLPEAPIGNRLPLLVPISIGQAVCFMVSLSRYPEPFPRWRKTRDPESP